jgi:hypothetical protein
MNILSAHRSSNPICPATESVSAACRGAMHGVWNPPGPCCASPPHPPSAKSIFADLVGVPFRVVLADIGISTVDAPLWQASAICAGYQILAKGSP